jgi:uncharacterized membrane protein YfhO
VETTIAQPADGRFGGDVHADRTAVVQLKASFDPRWTVTVDGRDAPTQMIAPGFVGVRVDPGDHRVLFVYHAYPFYWVLFALGSIVMIALVFVERRFLRPNGPEDVVAPSPSIE